MKTLNTILIVVIAVLFLTSCRENSGSNSYLNNDRDTVMQQPKGLPLDNLHRSRVGDSTVADQDQNLDIPLNNLERDKSTDTIDQL